MLEGKKVSERCPGVCPEVGVHAKGRGDVGWLSVGVSIEVGENVIGRLDVGGLSVWVTRKDDRGGGILGGMFGGMSRGCPERCPRGCPVSKKSPGKFGKGVSGGTTHCQKG